MRGPFFVHGVGVKCAAVLKSGPGNANTILMDKINDTDLRNEIVSVCHLMASGGLVAGTQGNVSGRAADGSILMTPSGISKGEITADMLVRLDLDGQIMAGGGVASSEKLLHLELYRQRSKVMGVAHGHPVFSSAFACAGRDLPDGIMPELVAVIGQIATVPYGRPSTPELAEKLAPFVRHHNVFLLQNHGSVAVAASVREAYHRLQVAEAYAKTIWAAEALGGAQPLTEAQITALPLPSFE